MQMTDDLSEEDATLVTMPPAHRPRVYLAGPDVFERDALGAGERLKALCAFVGLEGVYPLDAVVEPGEGGPAFAHRIFLANVRLLQSCEGVLVNMNPFRGPSMDGGTAWEMGFAFAGGLVMVGYTDDLRLYEERAVPDDFSIESFGLADNLMMACSVRKVCSTPTEAVAELARALVVMRPSLDV
jgi:nucleoside 2-deoxyribosyltransferase